MLIVWPALYDPFAVLEVNETMVGAVVSITTAVPVPIAFVPVGNVVDVIALPAVSRTVSTANEVTVRSAELIPDATVYVPVSVVPAEAAVSVSASPVSKVTVIVLPERTGSFVVAVIVSDCPALYEPSPDTAICAIVGAVVSITIAFAPAMLLVPLGTAVEVIVLPAASRTLEIVKLETVRSAEVSPDPTV